MNENQLSRIIVDSAVEVHRVLGGPGLLESVYEEALAAELRLRGVDVRRQVPIAVMYKGRPLATRLRLDLLANDKVIIECKSIPKAHAIFDSQALTYLVQSQLRLAMIINFGEKYVRRGIRRIVNHLEP
jgi:GxxExxY protein